MTGGDFLVLTPWALFTAGLAVVSVLLRRPARRGPAAPGDSPGAARRVPRFRRGTRPAAGPRQPGPGHD